MAGESAEVGQALWTSKDIILGLGTGVVAGITGYVGAYLKKGAEIKALSKNINDLKDQQVILTEATEQVRQDIEHQVWKKQELHQLKRQALEEYYECIDKLPYYLVDHYSYLTSQKKEAPKDLYNRASLLQQLYLSELQDQHNRLLVPMHDFFQFCSGITSYLIAGHTIETVKSGEFLEQLKPIRDAILPIISDIRNQVANEVQSIIGDN